MIPRNDSLSLYDLENVKCTRPYRQIFWFRVLFYRYGFRILICTGSCGQQLEYRWRALQNILSVSWEEGIFRQHVAFATLSIRSTFIGWKLTTQVAQEHKTLLWKLKSILPFPIKCMQICHLEYWAQSNNAHCVSLSSSRPPLWESFDSFVQTPEKSL